jgi:hypothetical protein
MLIRCASRVRVTASLKLRTHPNIGLSIRSFSLLNPAFVRAPPAFHRPPPNKKLSPAALHEAVTDLNNALLHRKGPWTVARCELPMHVKWLMSMTCIPAEARLLHWTTRQESFRCLTHTCWHTPTARTSIGINSQHLVHLPCCPSSPPSWSRRSAAGVQDKGRIFQDRSALAQARTSKSSDRSAVRPRGPARGRARRRARSSARSSGARDVDWRVAVPPKPCGMRGRGWAGMHAPHAARVRGRCGRA